jgi:hypothetical protein
VLRDEGEAFAARLNALQGHATLLRVNGYVLGWSPGIGPLLPMPRRRAHACWRRLCCGTNCFLSSTVHGFIAMGVTKAAITTAMDAIAQWLEGRQLS